VGACAGGITLAAALGHPAAKDALDCVASLTLWWTSSTSGETTRSWESSRPILHGAVKGKVE
jgi:poly(3-hydroxyalkanoate) synthetase